MSPTSGDGPPVHDARAWREALAILAGATVLRLALGTFVPLFPDEAYYWDWSRSLEAGYFDHPPLIALLVRGGTALFGHTPLGVRFFSIIAGTGAAAGLAFASRALAGDEAARTAALVFSCLPLAAAGFVLATPDAPMLCAVAWTLFAVIRALQSPLASRDSLRWWSLAGLCIGLAMASKYTAVLVPAAIAVACVIHPRLQNRYGEKGPYVAVVVAALVLAPVLWWNARHDWVSFQFQLGHGLGAPKGGALGALNRELELVGGQIGLVSPILFFFIVRALWRAFTPTPDGLRLVLGATATTCFAFFLYSATRRSVEANWPALAWMPAVVLLATEPAMPWRQQRWLNRGLALGAALAAVVCVHALFPILPLPASRDQVAKAYGWEAVGVAIDRRSTWLTSRASFGGTLYVGAERYQDAAQLAFHVGGHPRVFSLNLSGRPNQYDLWRTFRERASAGSTLLLVLDEESQEPKIIRKLLCCFRVDQGESVALMRRGQLIARKRLWLLSAWNGEWPRRDQPFPFSD